MAFNSQTLGTTGAPSLKLFGVLNGVSAKVKAAASSGLRTLQMARMMSVLSEMTDHQLHEIGISRADIPDYAKKLILGE